MSNPQADGGETITSDIVGVAFVAIKLLAIFLLVAGIADVFEFFPFLYTTLAEFQAETTVSPRARLFRETSVVSGLAPGVVYLIGAIVLWLSASKIARSIGRRAAANPIGFEGRIEALQIAAFSATGLVFLIVGLSSGAGLWLEIFNASKTEHLGPRIELSLQPRLMKAAVEAVLGLALLLSSRGLVRFVNWLRNVGH